MQENKRQNTSDHLANERTFLAWIISALLIGTWSKASERGEAVNFTPEWRKVPCQGVIIWKRP
jgi:hypothetical protein